MDYKEKYEAMRDAFDKAIRCVNGIVEQSNEQYPLWSGGWVVAPSGLKRIAERMQELYEAALGDDDAPEQVG